MKKGRKVQKESNLFESLDWSRVLFPRASSLYKFQLLKKVNNQIGQAGLGAVHGINCVVLVGVGG